MKSLETVQKIARVLEILALIAKIFTIIGLVFCLIGAALMFAIPGMIPHDLYEELTADHHNGEPLKLGLTLIAEAIFLAGQVVAAVYICNYFKVERADGTPFTHTGARLLRKTAVIAFAVSLAAETIAGILLLIAKTGSDIDMQVSLTGPLMVFLLSYVFDYGADLLAATPTATPSETEFL